MLAITTAAPDVSTSQQREWLPMPRGLEEDDSFAQDLIRQFDKRRSRLHAEMSNHLSQRWSIHYQPDTRYSSSTSSIVPVPSSSQPANGTAESNDNPLPQQDSPIDRRRRAPDTPEPAAAAAGPEAKRRKSASALLRRSSAYLRAKFEAFRAASRQADNEPIPSSSRQIEHKKATSRPRSMISASLPVRKRKRHHYPRADSTFSASAASLPLPSTIAINTTITIPHYHPQVAARHQMDQEQQYVHYATIQPPVITHFPPKPLKYSPVDPPSDSIETSNNDDSDQIRKRHRALHRFSVPLFNRGRGDAGSRASPFSETDTRPWAFPSLRRWSNLFGCGKTKKGKGKERGSPSSSSAVAT